MSRRKVKTRQLNHWVTTTPLSMVHRGGPIRLAWAGVKASHNHKPQGGKIEVEDKRGTGRSFKHGRWGQRLISDSRREAKGNNIQVSNASEDVSSDEGEGKMKIEGRRRKLVSHVLQSCMQDQNGSDSHRSPLYGNRFIPSEETGVEPGLAVGLKEGDGGKSDSHRGSLEMEMQNHVATTTAAIFPNPDCVVESGLHKREGEVCVGRKLESKSLSTGGSESGGKSKSTLCLVDSSWSFYDPSLSQNTIDGHEMDTSLKNDFNFFEGVLNPPGVENRRCHDDSSSSNDTIYRQGG
ncbi:unnamed protein product, partial [Choristocarpus tenellus]